MSDFDAFWSRFPKHEGKLAAIREYVFARRRARAEDILAGVERYRDHVAFTEPRYIAKPDRWLRDGRWMDEYESVPVNDIDVQLEECQRLHQGACGGSLKHRNRMLIERAG